MLVTDAVISNNQKWFSRPIHASFQFCQTLSKVQPNKISVCNRDVFILLWDVEV